MIVKNENKFVNFIKKFWVYIVASFLVVSIGTTLGVMAAVKEDQGIIDVSKPGEDEGKGDPSSENPTPSGEDENKEGDKNEDDDGKKVDTEPVTFALPMEDPSIIKDFSNTKLQYNATLDRWEGHLCIDFTAENLSVYSILDGVILSVDYDYLTGYVIKIQHEDGFVSRYASLDKNVLVKVGESVKKGQKIGTASSLAANESTYGDHLEFTLLKDDKKIDPNNYLNLQNK